MVWQGSVRLSVGRELDGDPVTDQMPKVIHHESSVLWVLVVPMPRLEIGEIYHQSEIALAGLEAEFGAEHSAYKTQILAE